MPLLETPGHSQASLGQSLVGSLLLSPGSWCAQGSVCALQESVSPVLCKFWWLLVELMATSSKRAYDIPKSATPRATAFAAGHCWPISLQETLKHSKAGLAQSLWGILVCTRFCLSPLSISGGYGSLLIQDGGVEDVGSSFPARTPKFQLAAEQPLSGDCWIPPKRITSHPRAKGEAPALW